MTPVKASALRHPPSLPHRGRGGFGSTPRHWRRRLGRVAVAGLLAGTLALLAAATASAGGSGAVIYIHTATAANTHGYWTDLDNKVTNGDPRAVVFVTANRTPNGSFGHPVDSHQVGVVWHAATHRWAIFNEDHAHLPVGAAFDVYALPSAGFSGIWVHTATVANSAGDHTNLDNPLTNGHSDQQLFVTPNRSPSGSLGAGVDDPHPIGVWYNGGAARWSVFQEDRTPEVIHSSYNIYDANGVSSLFLHIATAANTSGSRTCMDNSFLNHNPQTRVFVAQNWNPGGVGGTYNPHPVAVAYDHGLGRWCTINADGATLPLGASFNVFSA